MSSREHNPETSEGYIELNVIIFILFCSRLVKLFCVCGICCVLHYLVSLSCAVSMLMMRSYFSIFFSLSILFCFVMYSSFLCVAPGLDIHDFLSYTFFLIHNDFQGQ